MNPNVTGIEWFQCVIYLLTHNNNIFLTEAVHFARMMVNHGYFFSVEGSVPVRDDGTLFRFQVGREVVCGLVNSCLH